MEEILHHLGCIYKTLQTMGQPTNLNWLAGFLNHQQCVYVNLIMFSEVGTGWLGWTSNCVKLFVTKKNLCPALQLVLDFWRKNCRKSKWESFIKCAGF